MTSLAEQIQRDVAVIEGIRDVVPDEIQKEFRGIVANHCILATRIAFELLKHYDIRTRAVPVTVAVFNAAAERRIASLGRLPKDVAEMNEWAKEDGSWSVGVTGHATPTDANSWVGHLIALAMPNASEGSDGVLVDLSAPQFSRPSRQIEIPPLTQTVPGSFLAGEPCVLRVNGCIARYVYTPELQPWTNAPDWLDPSRREFPIKRAIGKIDLKLASLEADSDG